MTPAVALSQAALDVTPAYADEASAEPLTTWSGFSAAGATTIELTAVPATSFTYDGESHVLATTDFTVQLVVTGGDAEGTYTLANGAEPNTPALYEVTSVSGAGSADKSVKNGGAYTVKITATNGAPKVTSESDPAPLESGGVNPSKSISLTVSPRSIDVSKLTLKEPIVGVTPFSSLDAAGVFGDATEANTGEALKDVLTVSYPTKNGATPVTTAGEDTATNTTVYTTAGTYDVTLGIESTITPANAANYQLSGGVNKKPVKVVATGTYGATFGTGTDSNNEVKNPSATAAVSFDGVSTGVTAPLYVTAVTTNADNEEATTPLASAAYEPVVWTNVADGSALEGNPVLPGVYAPTITVGGAAGAVVPNDLKLTVTGDIATAFDEDNIYSKVTFNGVPVDDTGDNKVKLQDADNITAANVEEQIKKGLKITFGTGDDAVAVPEDAIDVNVENLDAKKATVGIVKGAGNGVFVGNFDLLFEYGEDLPAATLEDKALPYNGSETGWKLADLVEVLLEDKTELKIHDNYNVTATYTDAEGEEQTVTTVGTANEAAAKAVKIFDVADYEITVTPAGNYVGEPQTFDFKIEPVQVTLGKKGNATVSWKGLDGTSANYYTAFSGKAAQPVPTYTVTFDPAGAKEEIEITPVLPGEKVKPGDSTIAYANNTAVGDATATVTFGGNYKGTLSTDFTINAASVEDADVKAQSQLAEGFNADGVLNADDVVNPVVTLSNGATLKQGVDYEITNVYRTTSQSGVPAGQTSYTFAIKGIGNYEGVNDGVFYTTDKDITKLWAPKLTVDEYLYTGVQIKPAENGSGIKFYKPQAEGSTATPVEITGLVYGRDYAITYGENVDAGEGTLTIVGMGGYAGSIEVPFTIEALDITGAKTDKIVIEGAEDLVYTGKAFEPKVDRPASYITPTNDDYEGTGEQLSDYVDDIEITYENNTNASTKEAPAYVVIKGTGNVTGEVKVPFEIAPAELKAENVAVSAAVAPGADAADAVKVTFGETTLASGTDYAVKAEGTLPGAVKATVTGTGNFTGSVEKESAVLYDLSDVEFVVKDATYNGKAQTPVVAEAYYMKGGEKVAVPASAYTQAAGTYVDAGDYAVTFAGKASAGWTGEAAASFAIAKAAGPKSAEVTYTEAGAYKVTVPGLTEGKDFKVTPNPAQGKLVITYTGNYEGTATVDYKPAAKPVAPEQPAAGKTGWVGSGNDWAYYENGKAVKGQWKWIGGEWYHFEKSGKMTNTKWFQDADGTWYLLNQSHKGQYGAMLTGWQKVGKDWYYMDKSGAMQSGWAKVKGEWYLLNSKHDGTYGRMLTGWQQVGGKWYYMDASGEMASNEWVGRYWVNGSGVWTATR